MKKKTRTNSKYRELIAVIEEEGQFRLEWNFIDNHPDSDDDNSAGYDVIKYQEYIYNIFIQDADEALLALGLTAENQSVIQEQKYNPLQSGKLPVLPMPPGLPEYLTDSLNYIRLIALAYFKKLSKEPDLEYLRERIKVNLAKNEAEGLLENAPYMNGAEKLDLKWIFAVWNRLNEIFCRIIYSFKGSVADYFALFSPGLHIFGQVYFHLVEDGKGEYPFAFLATYSSVVSKDGKRKHLPLKNALIEYRNDKNHLLKLLSTVNNAAEKSSFITGIVDSGEIFHAIGLIPEEAYLFLKEVPIYEEAGILCRIPDWWRNHGNSYKLNINIGSKNKSRLNYDAIVDFNAELMLNGERVNADELKQMLSEAEGLRLIKGKWVEVNHDKLRKMLDAYDRALEYGNKATLGIVEAIRFQLDSGSELKVSRDECEIEITNGMWLNDVIGKLMLPDSMKSVTCSSNFCARLRPYQQTGLNWLNYMKELGLGACLADDMGLGKTVQVIALIDFICHRKKEKTLLVIPASLIGNWVDEIKRFAPLLRWQIIHPSAQNASQRNSEAENTPDCLQSSDIFITTYGMLLKYEWLKEVKWDTLVIDEAQAIKNPGTKQTHAVKSLKAASRIALTGTPVENRLSDLWSLFDFLNKGLLGSSREFSDFSKKIKESSEGYARLKKAVSPFILRRLKTDKSVISDLPEKIEIKSYASLTKKQVVLYEKLVDELTEKLTSSVEGIERKGLVLASLLKLKQICNHPDQYLGQKVYDIDDSGKFIRLKEICEIIRDNRERALIFTQFKEITDQLKNFLENIFRHEGLVLHGGTAVGKRKGIVEKFQGKDYIPFIVLSIKAGGVGLNLTAANHVIHFDRWWNPAVENQATDRAFRIGQNKNVIVHKFITKGTIEEKIDLMIEDKIKLFRNIVPESKESWITELDNNSLIELFKLR